MYDYFCKPYFKLSLTKLLDYWVRIVVHSVCERKFWVFMVGNPIKVLTDHKALVFILHCWLRNARLTRWTLLLQELDFRIDQITGSDKYCWHSVTSLSRSEQKFKSNTWTIYIYWNTPKGILDDYQSRIQSFRYILCEQRMDVDLHKIIEILTSNHPTPTISDRYCK